MSKQGSRWVELSKHAAVALGYALGFLVLREVSFSHWLLSSGFRFCALLLVPYRYWPALVIGEMGPLAGIAVTHSDKYGTLWSALYVFPPIALAMPVVQACKRFWGLFDSQGRVSVLILLFCALVCSSLWTAINLVTLSETKFPANYPQLSFTVYAARWFVGNFLGILTLAPSVLCVRELVAGGGQKVWRVLGSDLALDVLTIIVPSLALLVFLGLNTEQESLRQACRMAMFMPVVWLSLRHGWYGGALGGAAASVAIVLTMPERYDSGTLQAQVFMAFAITTMLLLGDRIALLNRNESRERGDAKLAYALAQRNMMLGEMQLRQTSHALEHVREGVQATYGQLLDRLRHMLPAADERDYRLRAAVAQQQLFRLADSLHPVVWREEGLGAALRQGSIARALDESGIRYWCDVHEQTVNAVGHGVQIALYRSVCDLVAHLGALPDVGSIRVHVRAGRSHSRKWVFVRAEGVAEQGAARRVVRDDLLLRLSVSGLGLAATRDRVALYNGLLRSKDIAGGQRISILLRDEQEISLAG